MRQKPGLITRLIVSSIAVFIAAWLLPGVELHDFTTAIGLAIILGILNATLKPLLVIITLPVTIMTLGLFLLIINAIIIGIADTWLDGLYVRSTWSAILFSLLISTFTSWLHRWGEQKN
ncbi:MAG: hypothetical protein RL754_1108 [Bacteroidota bacterium]|jgi:putative membrane protein